MAKTPEERRAYQRRYYQENKEKLKEYQYWYSRLHKVTQGRNIREAQKSGGGRRTEAEQTIGTFMAAPPEKAARMLDGFLRGEVEIMGVRRCDG